MRNRRYSWSAKWSMLALIGAIASPVIAESTQQGMQVLLRERGCYACHAMTETLIGPPYTAIAQRHAARKDVMIEVLAHKIIVGGAGNWGVVPMVPSEQVTEDEARAMARWILDRYEEKANQ